MARVAAIFVTAVAAFALSLYFFFPGYLALPVPYHPDMYWAADYAASGASAVGFLLAPRPIFYETLLFAGRFGLEGSLLFLDAIVLLDLALVIVLVEIVLLKRGVPWIIVAGTLLLAMTGPGFYKQPGYDVGFHLALLFGLLGVFAWELRSRKREAAAFLLTAASFALSVLSNEGAIPVLVIYCLAAAVRSRRSAWAASALALLPVCVVALSLWDSSVSHSPFVALSAARGYPYKIDLSLSSVLACFRFYAAPLVSAGYVALFAAAAFGLWLRRRLTLGAAIVLAALSLYLPYSVLPNHLDVTYQWAALPLIVCVVPLAWAEGRTAATAVARVALVAALGFCIAFASTQALEQKRWEGIAIAQNRSVLDALRSLKPRIRRSHNVLLCGLAFGRWPFLQGAAFLSRDMNFGGEWTVANEPGFPPVELQGQARPIDYGRIRWNDYDFIVLFNREGRFVAAYTKAQFRAKTGNLRVRNVSNRGLVDLLQSYAPPGVQLPGSWAAGAQHGLYLDTTRAQCCFLARKASLMLAKPSGDRFVIFTFEVPQTAPFASRPERVTMFFNGHQAGSPATLEAGIHTVRVALPLSLATNAQLEATLTMSVAYVPKEIGMNDDTRQLSIKLLRVDYRR